MASDPEQSAPASFGKVSLPSPFSVGFFFSICGLFLLPVNFVCLFNCRVSSYRKKSEVLFQLLTVSFCGSCEKNELFMLLKFKWQESTSAWLRFLFSGTLMEMN